MEPVRDPAGVEIEVLTSLGALQGRRVLEIGCGDGRLVRRYAGLAAAVAGIDPDPEELREALALKTELVKTPLCFVQARSEELPFAGEAFGAVLMGWSL